MSFVPSRILITLKNYLDIFITLEKSLELLRTPQVLSYLPLMIWGLRQFLFDSHLCGFGVLVLLTKYGVTRYFPFFPVIILDVVLDLIMFVTCEIRWAQSYFSVHLHMMMSLSVKILLLLIEFTISR